MFRLLERHGDPEMRHETPKAASVDILNYTRIKGFEFASWQERHALRMGFGDDLDRHGEYPREVLLSGLRSQISNTPRPRA